MRALIVEDDMASRMMLCKFLGHNFECETAENGLQAVEIFKQALEDNPFDLILMDIMMPVMDGQSALLAIREIEQDRNIATGKEVKAIMTTALADTKNITEAFSSGQADAYISKPVSRERVTEALRDVGLI